LVLILVIWVVCVKAFAGDVEFLVEKAGTFGGGAWRPVTLLLCDGLLVVFKATGVRVFECARVRV